MTHPLDVPAPDPNSTPEEPTPDDPPVAPNPGEDPEATPERPRRTDESD